MLLSSVVESENLPKNVEQMTLSATGPRLGQNYQNMNLTENTIELQTDKSQTSSAFKS